MNKKVYAIIEHYVYDYTEVLTILDLAKSVYKPIKQFYTEDISVVKRTIKSYWEYKVVIRVYEDRLQEDKSK